MILKKEIKNNIEYTVIRYEYEPTSKELIDALDIIHNSEYCKIIWGENIPSSDYIYYKNGRIHNEFDIAIHIGSYRYYGIYGEIEQTYDCFNKEHIKKLLRYKKLKNLKYLGM